MVITAAFRTLYVLVGMEIGSRRILHQNVTAHPASEWTLQQLREALPGDHPYRFLIHDRDSIFSEEVDKGLTNLSVRVLRTPVRAPKANAVCERLGGSLRRECLDFLIPFNEQHLQMAVRDWTMHYNRGRPHSALGPGLPEPMSDQVPPNEHRHRLTCRIPGCKEVCARGLASRIRPREGGCLATDFIFADYRVRSKRCRRLAMGGMLRGNTGTPFTPAIGGDPLGMANASTFDRPDVNRKNNSALRISTIRARGSDVRLKLQVGRIADVTSAESRRNNVMHLLATH